MCLCVCLCARECVCVPVHCAYMIIGHYQRSCYVHIGGGGGGGRYDCPFVVSIALLHFTAYYILSASDKLSSTEAISAKHKIPKPRVGNIYKES